MQETIQPLVARYQCKCGKGARFLSVQEPGRLPSKEERFFIAIKAPVKLITVEQARKEEFCFECSYERSAKKELEAQQKANASEATPDTATH